MTIKSLPPNFTLPKRLKKFFSSDINYNFYNSIIPRMENPRVGNLPHELIEIFPKEIRAQNIKLFLDTLGELAENLRKDFRKLHFIEDFSYKDSHYKKSKHIINLEKTAQIWLNSRLSELYPDLKARISFEGDGSFANIFKLSFFNKNGKIMHDKAMKIYHQVSEPYLHYAKSHNTFAEANFWTFLKFIAGHKLDKTQFTRHYLSDLKCGYALSEFADSDIQKTTAPLSLKLFNLKLPDDKIYNLTVNGKICDIGGFLKAIGFTSDIVTLRYLKKLNSRSPKELPQYLKRLQNLVNDPKTPHRNKISKAIELFKKFSGSDT